MSSYARVFVLFAVSLATLGSGCARFRHLGKDKDPNCPEVYSEEWWALEAQKPVGARQLEKRGKVWPPYPRPADDGGQQLSHEYHAAHYWPWPYFCDDRRYVRSLSDTQIGVGWMTETTLYSYHFAEETNLLTDAGRLHLRWVIENAPPQHRAVYVQAAESADASQARLAAVQKSAAEFAASGSVPPITLRVTSPLGRPALEVDAIRRAEIGSIPEPRIPIEAQATGTSASSSGQ